MTKYLDPYSVETGVDSKYQMYKIKRCRRKGVTIIKGQFCLFAKMTGSTIKILKLN